ncbi:hypothetical protein [Adlercreutzia sp. ZJ242]|uniref:hypothetical protein n=1 Tax=Adlercreutzia sp. ZJ242 TaxID=2709409 RepID=UPI0013E9CD47|nr:hypothetical protein [Adlercreutzia sp. ZJ242]
MDENQRKEDNQAGENPMQPPTLGRTAQLKSAQSLVTFGIIAGPVSMLLGGVLVSSIALACSIIAYVKVRGVISSEESIDATARAIQRQALVALAVSSVALVFNAIYLVIMMPSIIEAVSSGDLSTMFDFGNMPGQQTPPAETSSIWG